MEAPGGSTILERFETKTSVLPIAGPGRSKNARTKGNICVEFD
jgi:hypothetical protein